MNLLLLCSFSSVTPPRLEQGNGNGYTPMSNVSKKTSVFDPGCTNINFCSILAQFCIVLSSILHLFYVNCEVGLWAIEFDHGMSFFSVLCPHLRPPRSRLPQIYLSETSILPQNEIKNTSQNARRVHWFVGRSS